MASSRDIKSYRDLIVWQKAVDLAQKTYSLTKTFPKEELYALTSQMQRSAISVPANIAEGQARNSRKEFVHFLGIAKGSLAELETYLILAARLSYLGEKDLEEVLQKSSEVSKLLAGLQRSLADKSLTSY